MFDDDDDGDNDKQQELSPNIIIFFSPWSKEIQKEIPFPN